MNNIKNEQDIDRSCFILAGPKGGGEVYDIRIFEYLCEHEHILVLGKIPYIYQKGVYIADLSGSILKTMIRNLIPPAFIKSSVINRIYELFLSAGELQVSWEEMNCFPKHWINFETGFYDPKTKLLIPHDPKYRAINQIPHRYEPDRDYVGDLIERWLGHITKSDEEREMLLQYFGYCLTRDMSQQKFLILCGRGGTGKSVVVRILEKMVGSRNVSNIELQDLGQRFVSFGLMGKMLNACADLRIQSLGDVSMIKKILGEDTIRAEPKGKDAISFRNYAKMIFSTNELPAIYNERTNGFYRRVIIHMMNTLPSEVVPDFIDNLVGQIDYLIRLSVQALSRMYETGKICESESSIRAVEHWRLEVDTVQRWIMERNLLAPESRMERGRCYQDYCTYAKELGCRELSKQAFYRTMRTKGFSEVKSDGYWYFKGIGKSGNFI